MTDVENGDYYLGLYLVEDVINKQASRTNSELHKNVLRTSLLEGAFGKSLVKGAVSKGKTFVESFSIPNMNADRTKIKIVGIIWTKVNDKYRIFNANISNVSIPASIESFISDAQMNVFQSESGNLVLEIDATKEISNAVIQVTDVTGKLMVNQIASNLHTGKQRISIDGSFSTGVHIVSLKNGSQITSKKLVIQ
ncbi:MAG: T9SS type A sorting domain-containing protein [Saprospiraceae bacterium]|nr:T9SS type A sorting domain-containing protein [Saprospiraceae bacterium]